jgi:hypothetical protein
MDPWGEPSRARHLEPVSGLFRMAISRKHFLNSLLEQQQPRAGGVVTMASVPWASLDVAVRSWCWRGACAVSA